MDEIQTAEDDDNSPSSILSSTRGLYWFIYGLWQLAEGNYCYVPCDGFIPWRHLDILVSDRKATGKVTTGECS